MWHACRLHAVSYKQWKLSVMECKNCSESHFLRLSSLMKLLASPVHAFSCWTGVGLATISNYANELYISSHSQSPFRGLWHGNEITMTPQSVKMAASNATLVRWWSNCQLRSATQTPRSVILVSELSQTQFCGPLYVILVHLTLWAVRTSRIVNQTRRRTARCTVIH